MNDIINMRIFLILFLCWFGTFNTAVAGDNNGKFDVAETALHHIADANHWFLFGNVYIPLPCILYDRETGDWSVFMSSKFEVEEKGTGTKAIDRYVLNHGMIQRVKEKSFPMGVQDIKLEGHGEKVHVALAGAGGHDHSHDHSHDGHDHDHGHGEHFTVENRSIWDGGMLGGGMSSYYDFSITKNVATMMIAFLFLGFVFFSMARAYKKWNNQGPKTFWQRLLEPVFIFLRDDICKPVIGEQHYMKFLPYIAALFFFILFLNLIGQIPFIGNPNVSGSISVTIVLAIFTLIITNINGTGHYWEHILWMPGVPAWVKVILTPIEILGVFLKPFTLLVRLFANITAGHIIILSFIGLIFVFADIGVETGMGRGAGAMIGGVLAFALGLFMSAIELLVAFLQAYIFAVLSASYIGAAVDTGHDHH